MSGLDLRDLRVANRKRQTEWTGSAKIDVLFRTVEVAGETGELCEAVKKLYRSQHGITGSTAALDDVTDEMGDVLISLDLLAMELGIDLSAAVAAKFNKTSAKHGMSTRLQLRPPKWKEL